MPRHRPHHVRDRAAWHDARLWGCLGALLPVMLVFFQHASTLPLFMVRTLHLAPSVYGAMFSVNTALILLLEIPINGHTTHWPYRRTLAAGAFLLATGFGLLAFCAGTSSVLAAVAVWTFGEMLLLPAATSYVSDLAPPGRSGQYIGMYSALVSVSMMLGPALGAAVLEHYGPSALWLGCWFVGLSSVVWLAMLPLARPLSRKDARQKRVAVGAAEDADEREAATLSDGGRDTSGATRSRATSGARFRTQRRPR
jgi:MFS family permease